MSARQRCSRLVNTSADTGGFCNFHHRSEERGRTPGSEVMFWRRAPRSQRARTRSYTVTRQESDGEDGDVPALNRPSIDSQQTHILSFIKGHSRDNKCSTARRAAAMICGLSLHTVFNRLRSVYLFHSPAFHLTFYDISSLDYSPVHGHYDLLYLLCVSSAFTHLCQVFTVPRG